MSHKRKGSNAERELVRFFWERGWATLRAAGSGSQQYPCPDVLAGKNGRRLAIECKMTSSQKKYLSLQELNELQYFANTFGAEAWIGVRFHRENWFFLQLEDIPLTAKHGVISLELAKLKGLTIQELTEW